jgi:hypothetical protein
MVLRGENKREKEVSYKLALLPLNLLSSFIAFTYHISTDPAHHVDEDHNCSPILHTNYKA